LGVWPASGEGHLPPRVGGQQQGIRPRMAISRPGGQSACGWSGLTGLSTPNGGAEGRGHTGANHGRSAYGGSAEVGAGRLDRSVRIARAASTATSKACRDLWCPTVIRGTARARRRVNTPSRLARSRASRVLLRAPLSRSETRSRIGPGSAQSRCWPQEIETSCDGGLNTAGFLPCRQRPEVPLGWAIQGPEMAWDETQAQTS